MSDEKLAPLPYNTEISYSTILSGSGKNETKACKHTLVDRSATMLQRTSSRLVLCLLALPSLRRSEYPSTSVLRASGYSSTKTSCTSATKISTYSSASAMRYWRRRSFSLCSLTKVSTTLAKIQRFPNSRMLRRVPLQHAILLALPPFLHCFARTFAKTLNSKPGCPMTGVQVLVCLSSSSEAFQAPGCDKI